MFGPRGADDDAEGMVSGAASAMRGALAWSVRPSLWMFSHFTFYYLAQPRYLWSAARTRFDSSLGRILYSNNSTQFAVAVFCLCAHC